MIEYGPNPPTRKEEDFPKTTTIPEGWVAESLPLPGTAASQAGDENTRPAPVAKEEGLVARRPQTPEEINSGLFSRSLEPFPKPNTIPTGWDLSAME